MSEGSPTIDPSLALRLRRQWGWAWLALVAAVSLVQLQARGASGHYEIFAQAARGIWAGANPYLVVHPSGHFNYSPACALFYYSLFAYFPDGLGLMLYMLSSLALFFYGLKRFVAIEPLPRSFVNLFLFIVSSELIGTVLNARFELVTLGGWFVAASLIARRERLFIAYFVLAMLANFKLQTLPLAGLLLVYELVARRSLRPTLYFAASLAFWAALPLVFVSPERLVGFYRGMQANLSGYVLGAWLSFQHVFAFLFKVTAVAPSWRAAQFALATLGLLLALLVACRAARDPRPARVVLLVFALGGAYAAAWLPMSQSAAYLLYAPLVWVHLADVAHEPRPAVRRALWAALWISFFFVSIAYSDLVPRGARVWFFDHSVKGPGVALLMGVVALRALVFERADDRQGREHGARAENA